MTNFRGVILDSEVSTDNSTTDPLAASATFTGEWELNAYPDVSVVVQTDQDSTLYFDFSIDGGTNYSTFPVNGFQVAAGINEIHVARKFNRSFRVRVTNDSTTTAQTYLRVHTEYGDFKSLNAPINQSIGNDADANITRPTKYEYEVAQGLRGGASTWNKWGYNAAIGTTQETVWSVGGLLTRMTSADTLDIVSSDANDTSAGTGAQSIIIYGIDENYEAQIEVVTMNGTTPVTTTNQWLGVNRMSIYLAGSGGENAGTITATVTTGGATQAEIPATEGSTQHAFFFVQANHQLLSDWLYINAVKLSGGGQPVITIEIWVTSLVSGAKYLVAQFFDDTQTQSALELKPSQPFVVGEKSLFEVRAVSDTASTGVNVRFSGVEVQIL